MSSHQCNSSNISTLFFAFYIRPLYLHVFISDYGYDIGAISYIRYIQLVLFIHGMYPVNVLTVIKKPYITDSNYEFTI